MGAIPSCKPAQIGEALPTLQGVAGNTEGKIVEKTFPVTTQRVRPLDGFRHIITMMISITRRPWYLIKAEVFRQRDTQLADDQVKV